MMFIDMERVAFLRVPDGRRLRLAVVSAQPEKFGFDGQDDVIDTFEENGTEVNVLNVRSLYKTLTSVGYVHFASSSK